LKRGEVWWADLPAPVGRRPVVLLSRNKAIEVRQSVTVVPVTTKIRNLPTEIQLGRDDGMPRDCAANADVIVTIQKTSLVDPICVLSREKMTSLERAVKFALALP
jgi:mRNA interferase MazF